MRLLWRPAPIAVLSVTALAVAGCVGAPEAEDETTSPGFPVEVTSCDHTTTITARPERAVTLNQGATEVALALGVADQLAGTAYLDDEVAPEWLEDYEYVPVLAQQYPTREDLLAADPDLVYASYASAFEEEAVGTRGEFEQDDVGTYLSPFGCPEAAQRPEPSFEAVWEEIDQVATAFGVPDRAAEIREAQQTALDQLTEERPGAGLTVFWYDSGTQTPLVGAGGSGPQLIIDVLGAENIFGDLEGGWADASWEQVVAADPDVIVISVAAWSSAGEKLDHLRSDPVLSQLTAVREERFLTLPYSETTPGVRLADGAVSLGEQLEALTAPR